MTDVEPRNFRAPIGQGAPHAALAARLSVSLTDLFEQHRSRAGILVQQHLLQVPGSTAAVLELEFRASGGTKRRLRRRLGSDVTYHLDSRRRGTLIARVATSFDWLVYQTALGDLIARDSGAALVACRLLSVG